MRTVSMGLLNILAAVLFVSSTASPETGPVLKIPDRIPGVFATPVAVPIVYASHGEAISAVIFSLDYDEECLLVDADFDGLPDDISFMVPGQFTASATYDPNDPDGELDFFILDFAPPLSSLPDGVLATITFTPSCEPVSTSILATIGFSQDPPLSFGGGDGQSVPGTSFDGSVEIRDPIFADGFESGDTAGW